VNARYLNKNASSSSTNRNNKALHQKSPTFFPDLKNHLLLFHCSP